MNEIPPKPTTVEPYNPPPAPQFIPGIGNGQLLGSATAILIALIVGYFWYKSKRG